MRRRLHSALLAITIGAFSATALADPAMERETARALMDDGDRQFQSGDFTAARVTYARARALVRAPTTGLAVAEAEERLGLFVEARDSALEVTRMPVTPGEPAVFAESRELARALAARVLPRIGVLDLTIQRGAMCGPVNVTVDGSRWPDEALGAPLHLDPGLHRIEARASGCVTVEQAIEVIAARAVLLRLELRPLGATADPGTAPPDATPTSPPRDIGGSASRRPLPTGAIALMGVGAVGVAVGLTAGVVSLGKTSTVREICGDARCPAGEDDYQTANTTAWIANGALAVGIVAGTAGVLWALLTRSSSAAASMTVGPRSAGLSIPFM